jgi:hypothetical protein
VAAGTLSGGLGPAQTLVTAPGGAVRDLQAAAAGGSLVAWAESGPGRDGAQRLRYAARGVDAPRFGGVRTLARVASATGSQLRVAAGPDGTALAVWRDRGRLLSATARRGRFGAPCLLTRDGVFPASPPPAPAAGSSPGRAVPSAAGSAWPPSCARAGSSAASSGR